MNMEVSLKYIQEFIRFLNGSNELSCWRGDERFPYSLPLHRCEEGKVMNCNDDYCNGRGVNDFCCKLQKHINHIQQKLTGMPTNNLEQENAEKKVYILSAVCCILVIFIILLCVGFFLKRRQDRRTYQQRLRDLEQKKDGDTDSGLASAFSSITTDDGNGLMNSNGSLNKKKIHAQPENSQSHMENEDAHQLYLLNEKKGTALKREDIEETRLLTLN